jgi:hypothetical protein
VPIERSVHRGVSGWNMDNPKVDVFFRLAVLCPFLPSSALRLGAIGTLLTHRKMTPLTMIDARPAGPRQSRQSRRRSNA